jgi:hypothetical protein
MMKNKNAMMSDFIAEQEKTIWMMQRRRIMNCPLKKINVKMLKFLFWIFF